MKVSDDVQHKYNSMTKEKGAEYKKYSYYQWRNEMNLVRY